MKQVNRMIPTTKIDQRQSNTLTLREGQVVTGRVMKFFPGNKAMINLSGHQVVAQLDASLQSNQSYLLQVKGTSPAIQLQVVHNQSVNSFNDAAQKLLELSGMKTTKPEQLLIANMLKEQLPIQPNQTSSIVQLARTNHVPNQQQILTEMVQRQLPINQDVFNAIHQKINQPLSFTQVVNQVQNQLSQTNQSEELYQLNNRLNILSQQPVNNQKLLETFVYQTLKEISSGSTTTFQMMKKAGLVSNQMTFQEWSNTWSNWAKQNQVQFNVGNQTTLPQLPMNMSSNQLTEAIQQLAQQQLGFNHKQLQVVQSVGQHLNQIQQSTELNSYQQNLLQRGLTSNLWNQLTPHLSDEVKPTMQLVQNLSSNTNWNQIQQLLQSVDGQKLLNQINQLINNQVNAAETRALSYWQSMVALNNPEHNNSMHQLRNFIQLMQVDSNVNQDYPTLASLTRTSQGQLSQSPLGDSLQQLNQIINSMHLSHNDLNQRELMNFSVQFPKNMFGLNQDLFMDFEGKKQEDGTIHPKQCRVLFYLDLPHLNETILDMHVQNGHVDLTVFHQQPDYLKNISKPFMSQLNDKLLNQDYSSVQVQYKHIQERLNNEQNNYSSNIEWRQGVDFRI